MVAIDLLSIASSNTALTTGGHDDSLVTLIESVHSGVGHSCDGRIVVIGSLNADLVQIVERLPVPGQTLRGSDLRVLPGGKGANQACTVGRLGGDVVMIGNVGRDPFSSLLLESLRSCGVNTAGVDAVAGSSGAATIVVLPGGENSIVISSGANGCLTGPDVIRRMRPFGVRIVLCQLEVPLEATETALKEARSCGALTILDPAPMQPLSPEMLSLVDYLTPNQTEALALLGCEDQAIDTVAGAIQVAESLLAFGPSNVILKIGRLGCILATRTQTHAVSAFDVHAVDTTGAGDVFNGAFASMLAEGRSALDAAVFANAAAAVSVTRLGAQSSIPSRHEVEHFLQRAAAVASR